MLLASSSFIRICLLASTRRKTGRAPCQPCLQPTYGMCYPLHAFSHGLFSLPAMLSLSLLSVFVFGARSVQSAMARIPLTKLTPSEMIASDNTTMAGGINVPVSNYSLVYYATIFIGTPPQPFRLLLDTGSADLLVVSKYCNRCDNFGVPGEGYNPNASATYQPSGLPIKVRFGAGNVEGFTVIDTVALDQNMSVMGQMFIDVNASALSFDLELDGILGLGLPALSVDQIPTVFENAIAQNLVHDPVFALYLSDNAPELTWGGYDPTKFHGQLAFVPGNLAAYPFWAIALDKVAVGNHGIHLRKKKKSNRDKKSIIPALIDCTVGFIYGPTKQVAAIAKLANANLITFNSSKAEFWLFPQSEVRHLPDIVFTIGGIDYPLSWESLSSCQQKWCFLHIIGQNM